MQNLKIILAWLLPLFSLQSTATTWEISSSDKQTILIELFSSEGCSSCPPADRFVSQFKDSEKLWHQYLPLVFHVDYWDYIGWKDVFASPDYSARQRNYQTQGHLNSVYTPGFVVNGKEWRGFFKPWPALPETQKQPGKLKVVIENYSAVVDFTSSKKTLNYHLAVVGMGLKTHVRAGENSGRELLHDFVVLDHQKKKGQAFVTFNLPLIVKHRPEEFALIAWVSTPIDMQPIQAVGGILPAGYIKQL